MAEQAACKWYEPSCIAQWFIDEVKSLWIFIYDAFMSGLASLIEAIGVPDFLMNLHTVNLPPGVSWFLAPLNLLTGIGIIVGAYIARFILRRIPFIG